MEVLSTIFAWNAIREDLKLVRKKPHLFFGGQKKKSAAHKEKKICKVIEID